MTKITPGHDMAAELAEVRAMVADLAATFASVIAMVADVKHQEGYELGLAERGPFTAAARARKPRARFKVIAGGAA